MQTFTYKSSHMALPGSRVVVPFSNRLLQGYVMEEVDEPETLAATKIKAIEEVVDFRPILDHHRLSLAQKTAHYYMTPIGMVMDLFFSGSPKIQMKQRIVLVNVDQPVEGFLKGEVSVDLHTFLGRFSKPKARKILQQAIIDERVEIVFAYSHSRPKTRMIKTVSLNTSVDALIQNHFTAQGWDIVQFLLMHDHTPLDQLKERLHLKSLSPVHTLQKKGMVTIYEEQQPDPEEYQELRKLVKLNPPQEEVFQSILKGIKAGRLKHLLYGITGSGKTEVYFSLMEHILNLGRQVLYLLPEISLTPQMIARIRSRFDTREVGIVHSMIAARQRSEVWEKAVQGEIPILVGTRSALWAPLPDLGLIVVDEEHDESYMQQENAPVYDVHLVSQWISEIQKIPVVFGSATPRLESFYQARTEKTIQLHVLGGRPSGVSLPSVSVVDLIHHEKVNWLFSKEMIQRMDLTLSRKKQTFILVQKKGFASYVYCAQCGYVHHCTYCDVSMTYHKPLSAVKCHYCGYEEPLLRICPQCKSRKMIFRGFGTEKVEEYLTHAFPEARIMRIDRELIKDNQDLRDALSQIQQARVDIVVGTKMISKGLDYPNVELVVVLDADQSLHFPDFRSVERTFQLISQMSGRAGRGEQNSEMGRVVVQTLSPGHPAIHYSTSHDYPGFYDHELQLRKEALYPPFCHIISIQWEGYDAKATLEMATEFASHLQSQGEGSGDIHLGPVPALIFKLSGIFRYHMIVKTMDQQATADRIQMVFQSHRNFSKYMRVVVDPIKAMI